MSHRDDPANDNALSAGRRLLRVGRRTGLLREILSAKTPQLAYRSAKFGLSVRSVHALHAVSHPSRLAVVDEHRSVTYGEADLEINRIGNALRERLAVRSGDPVVLMMENRCEYLLSWFALFRIGASGVHASYRMTAEELEYQVEHSGASILIVSEAALEAARTLRSQRPDLDLELIVVSNGEDVFESEWGYQAFQAGASERFAEPERRADGDSRSDNIVYTSGTTGKPKGTVRNFASFGINELTRIVDRLPLEVGDKHLLVAPMYHSGGQVFCLMHAALAATIYMRPKFDAEDALESLHKWDIDSAFMVPTMIRRVLDLPDDVHRANPASGLKALVSGAAPFPQDLRRRAIERFGASAIHDFYGATEIGWVTLITGEEMLERPSSVGQPLPGQHVYILDDDMNVLPPGEVGTIYVANEQKMSGYLRDREANDETFVGDMVTVDDLGYLDEDHYLYLAGRSRDMVISGGVNIYPVEIEDVLVQHESVQDAAVIGVADREWGERLVAILVGSDDLDLDEIEAFARGHLSSHKVPRQWDVLDELPRNPTGKIQKNELEQRYNNA
ncbi:MAG: class I adenylate-forming enzyme family protein [Myxococcota bacterium]